MEIKQKVTILKVEEKSGIAKKSGEPYHMVIVKILDEDYNVFDISVAKALTEVKARMADLLSIRNEEYDITLTLKPKGFDYSLTLTDF